MRFILHPIIATGMIICSTLCALVDEMVPLWSFDADAPVLSAPAVDAAGNVYFGGTDNRIYSTTSDGDLRWIFSGATDWMEAAPALDSNGRIYASSWDNHLYAINADNGALVWKFETGNYLLSSPAIDAEGNLYFGSADNFFYSVSPDGQMRWFHIAQATIEGGAAIGTNGVVYFGDLGGQLYALDMQSGVEVWRTQIAYETESNGRSPAIRTVPAIGADGTIYVGCADHRLYAVSPSGQILWFFEASEEIDSSPAIGPGNRIYFSSRNGFLYAVDADGELAWDVLVGDVFYCSPAVDALGNVYIASYVGNGISALNKINQDGVPVADFLWIGFNDSSPTITGDQRLVIGFHDGWVFAFNIDAAAADTSWPQFRREPANTARLPGDFRQTAQGYFPLPIATDGDWQYLDPLGWVNIRLFPWIHSDTLGWLHAMGKGSPWQWYHGSDLYLFTQPGWQGWFWEAGQPGWHYQDPRFGLIKSH